MTEEQTPEAVDLDRLRAEAAERIVREALERDRLAMELAAKTIFRRGNVQ